MRKPLWGSIANCIQALVTVFGSAGAALEWLNAQRSDPTRNGDLERAYNDFQNRGGEGYLSPYGGRFGDDDQDEQGRYPSYSV
jgi:hypothetical protein